MHVVRTVRGFDRIVTELKERNATRTVFGKNPKVTAMVKVKFRNGRSAFGRAGFGISEWQLNVQLLTNHHGLLSNFVAIERADSVVSSIWKLVPFKPTKQQ